MKENSVNINNAHDDVSDCIDMLSFLGDILGSSLERESGVEAHRAGLALILQHIVSKQGCVLRALEQA